MARLFTGGGNPALFNSTAAVTAAPFTVASWVRPINTTGGVIFALDTTSGGGAINRCWVTSDTVFNMFQWNVGTFSGFSNTNVSINGSVWFHVVAVFNGASSAVYVYGGNVATGTVAAMPAGLNGTTIGNSKSTSGVFQTGYTGGIADCAIWNIALGTAAISALASGTRPGNVNAANLAGWWPIDGYASPEPDLSSAGLSMTLNSTPSQSLGPPPVWRLSYGG